jgi:hypothetical protein
MRTARRPVYQMDGIAGFVGGRRQISGFARGGCRNGQQDGDRDVNNAKQAGFSRDTHRTYPSSERT